MSLSSKKSYGLEKKRIYHKPIYGLTAESCRKRSYRHLIDNKCSYRKCRGKSRFYDKYKKCLSMKHYNDIEPSRKTPYHGKDPRKICESTHRGSNWRFYDGNCYKKSCNVGSVYDYGNGRCTKRRFFFKRLMRKYRELEDMAVKRFEKAVTPEEKKRIYKSVEHKVQDINKEGKKLLDDIKKNPTPSKILLAKKEKYITSSQADILKNQPSKKSAVIEDAKKNISAQGFGLLNRLRSKTGISIGNSISRGFTSLKNGVSSIGSSIANGTRSVGNALGRGVSAVARVPGAVVRGVARVPGSVARSASRGVSYIGNKTRSLRSSIGQRFTRKNKNGKK